MKNRMVFILLLAVALTGLFGFKLDNAIVPKEEIVSGGPPKDGIPAIMDPKFVTAKHVEYLEDDEKVIVVDIGGSARAYPINILTWHEVVNDHLGGIPIAVTF